MEIIRNNRLTENCINNVCDIIRSFHKEHVNPELNEWFENLDNNINRINANVIAPDVMTEKGNALATVQLLLVLRECLLTHRWLEASAVVSSLIETSSSCRHVIHKAGAEIFYNSSSDCHEILEPFLNQMKRLRDVMGMDVALEHSLYLLMQGKTELASLAIKELPVKMGGRYKNISKNEVYNQKRYMGYVGIMRYYEYRLIKERIDKRQKDGEGCENMSMVDTDYPLMVVKANEAIECLQTLLMEELISNWDFFITALVELLEFRELPEDALMTLHWYEARSPDNPNACRYLIQYYQRHGDLENELKYMQQFCDAIPSDEMVLELYERLIQNGSPTRETMHLLFDLLDYGHWASQLRPWSLLATQLEKILKIYLKSHSPDDQYEVELCWSQRCSWWPSFHFTTKGSPQPELLVHKARVAVFLLGHESSFVEEIIQLEIQQEEIKYLKRSIRRTRKAINKLKQPKSS